MHEPSYSGTGKFQLKIFYVAAPGVFSDAHKNTQEKYGNACLTAAFEWKIYPSLFGLVIDPASRASPRAKKYSLPITFQEQSCRVNNEIINDSGLLRRPDNFDRRRRQK
jgi:hypothetical protein